MFKIYTICEGEDINSIADKFSTTREMLLEINGFEEDVRVSSGNMMIVPNNNLVFQKYQVKKGDTIYSLAQKTGTDVNTLLEINGLDEGDYIYPDEFILLPTENVMIYVTKKGDTIADVASNFKTTRSNIVETNEIIVLEPEQLFVHKKK